MSGAREALRANGAVPLRYCCSNLVGVLDCLLVTISGLLTQVLVIPWGIVAELEAKTLL
jgi:hypothetical protein